MKNLIMLCIMLFIEDYFILKFKDKFLNLLCAAFICLDILCLFISNIIIEKLYFAMFIVLYMKNVFYIRKLREAKEYKMSVYHHALITIILAIIIYVL